MAARDQLLTQGRVIVNLSVKNQPKAFILIGEGLSALRREINDAQLVAVLLMKDPSSSGPRWAREAIILEIRPDEMVSLFREILPQMPHIGF